jgi:hypothetical protein
MKKGNLLPVVIILIQVLVFILVLLILQSCQEKGDERETVCTDGLDNDDDGDVDCADDDCECSDETCSDSVDNDDDGDIDCNDPDCDTTSPCTNHHG